MSSAFTYPDVAPVLAKLNTPALLSLASSLAGTPAALSASVPAITAGWILLILDFPAIAGQRWAARIPRDQDYPFVTYCAAPLLYAARAFPRVPAPRVHAYAECGTANPLGVGYMLVDWIAGTPLRDVLQHGTTPSQRHRVMEQLARAMLDMLTQRVEPGDDVVYYGVPAGTPPHTPVSTTAWLTTSVDRLLKRCLARRAPRDAIYALIARSMVPRHVAAKHEHSAWVVCHGDLHGGNIIIDGDSGGSDEAGGFNIAGLIDWDYTAALPLQKAAVWPKLLHTLPGGGGVGGELAADKELFLRIFAAQERARTGATALTELIATSEERAFFEVAHHVAPIREAWVERYCDLRDEGNLSAAERELGRFVDGEGEGGFVWEHESVSEVAEMLRGMVQRAQEGRDAADQMAVETETPARRGVATPSV